MDKKRGLLFVTLGLLLFLSFNVFAVQYEMITWWGDCDEPDDDNCPDLFEIHRYVHDISAFEEGTCDAHGEEDELPLGFPASDYYRRGCYIHLAEDDGYENDCGWVVISPGHIAGYTPDRAVNIKMHRNTPSTSELHDDKYDFDDDINEFIFDDSDHRPPGKLLKVGNGLELLCTVDEHWTQCDESLVNTSVWISNRIYRCVQNEEDGAYIWEKLEGVDSDHDGYTLEIGDCQDDTSSDPEYCSELETPADCNFPAEPKNAQCAICINPGMPEICGDGIGDNSATDPTGGKGNDCNSETSDECHQNQYACEQSYRGAVPIEEAPEPPSTASEEAPADATGEATAGEDVATPYDPGGKPEYNIFNTEFSWIETDDGGYCCGYEGLGDLGKIESGKADGLLDSFVCLNKENDLVGKEGEFSDWPTENSDGTPGRCPGSWCWVKASGNAKFDIYTLRPLSREPFDIVSNGVEWFRCSEEGPLATPSPTTAPEGGIENLYKKANRFYCYKEGNHWSWAECAGTPEEERGRENPGIKGRYGGEGLYTLPLVGPDGILEERTGKIIDIYSSDYEDFYGEDFTLDFTGYDYLNFMVKFEDNLVPPADVKLEIHGINDVLYYSNTILGHTTNSPLYGNHFMHVQVPIPWFKGVMTIMIMSEPQVNTITVRNVYLSRGKGKNKLCSGEDAVQESSWLDDFDQADPQKEISGQHLCTELFGEEAWLGNSEEVDLPSASCCGNTKSEYYAGSSHSLPEENIHYACWNSQPIAQGTTTMDVEYLVQYYENNTEFPDPEITFSFSVVNSNGKEIYAERTDTLTLGEFSKSLGRVTLPQSYFYNETNDEYFILSFNKIINRDYVELFFVSRFNLVMLEELGYNDFQRPVEDFSLVAKFSENYQPLVITKKENKKKKYTFSCNRAECLFPLPGEPPYTITNFHPELYDLYFVTEEGIEINVGKEAGFGTFGNLKVKRVAQQVIFVSSEDVNPSFYGCQAASYVEEATEYLINQPYCSARSGMFCSYSTSHEEDGGFNTINSWSDENIEMVGYETVELSGESLDDFYEHLTLNLKPEEAFTAAERNTTSLVIPARNFISNAEFVPKGYREVPNWEFIGLAADEEEALTEMEQGYKVTLGAGERLLSERVAVPQYSSLHYSANLSCAGTRIVLIDKDGNSVAVEDFSNIETGNHSTLLIEFVGPCVLYRPMLQLKDELGPVSYYKKEYQEYPESYDARAGLACCPYNYCWNGYACVEPMTSGFLVEHIAKGRDYRCVNSEWKYQPVKFDWYADQWGFCDDEKQCFVSPSGEMTITAAQFYDGDTPVCINNQEYIFDHYCDSGNWSSRTKQLAEDLVKLADEVDYYVLYCAPYPLALPGSEQDEQVIYLGGETFQALNQTLTLGEAIGGQQSSEARICFPDADTSLISDSENTCVNNVCILKVKKSGEDQIIFATTLNRPLEDPNSFLNALNIYPAMVSSETCDKEEMGFIKCSLPSGAELWYSTDLNAIIYGQDGLDVKTVWGTIAGFFRNLFTSESQLSDENSFVQEAKNFRNLYIAKVKESGEFDEMKVRALMEIFKDKKMLVAEYEGFATPLCEYAAAEKINHPDFQVEALEAEQGRSKLVCTVNETKQKIEAIGSDEGLQFLWPQLTGRLRVNED